MEAFLPISALLGLKRLVMTGNWDPVHPAGLSIFLAILIASLLWRKGFCAWTCPVGAVSNMFERIGRRLGTIRNLPSWIDLGLLSLKYLLLGFFIYIILWKMNLKQVEGFISSPYNISVDARMLLFFTKPSFLSLAVFAFLALTSLFIRNFWCRYLCPYGALLGILALASPVQITRDQKSCTGCGKCERACPSSIKITRMQTVRTCECTGCMECLPVCPVKECLSPSLVPGRKRVPKYLIPLGTVLTLAFFYILSLTFGHWHSLVPDDSLKNIYQMQLLANPG